MGRAVMPPFSWRSCYEFCDVSLGAFVRSPCHYSSDAVVGRGRLRPERDCIAARVVEHDLRLNLQRQASLLVIGSS
jgi:hypothetical protein